MPRDGGRRRRGWMRRPQPTTRCGTSSCTARWRRTMGTWARRLRGGEPLPRAFAEVRPHASSATLCMAWPLWAEGGCGRAPPPPPCWSGPVGLAPIATEAALQALDAAGHLRRRRPWSCPKPRATVPEPAAAADIATGATGRSCSPGFRRRNGPGGAGGTGQPDSRPASSSMASIHGRSRSWPLPFSAARWGSSLSASLFYRHGSLAELGASGRGESAPDAELLAAPGHGGPAAGSAARAARLAEATPAVQGGPVAVIGMAGRFPAGPTSKASGHALLAGRGCDRSRTFGPARLVGRRRCRPASSTGWTASTPASSRHGRSSEAASPIRRPACSWNRLACPGRRPRADRPRRQRHRRVRGGAIHRLRRTAARRARPTSSPAWRMPPFEPAELPARSAQAHRPPSTRPAPAAWIAVHRAVRAIEAGDSGWPSRGRSTCCWRRRPPAWSPPWARAGPDGRRPARASPAGRRHGRGEGVAAVVSSRWTAPWRMATPFSA